MTLDILINGQKADIGNEIELNLNYQVQDIRNIGKSNTSFSKTITFPGTNVNNNIFSNIFDVNFETEFNPLQKADIQIYDGGLLIFKGYLKLDSINIIKDTGIEYQCTAYSSLGDIFSDLGQIKLSDLDLSEYNHYYTLHNVVGSWNDFIVKYGNEVAFNKGEGYVYPYLDYGIGTGILNIKRVEFFRPSIYAKTLVDKIFSKVGYTYESEFFNSDYFKSLIIVPPLQGSYYDQDIIEQTKLQAELGANYTYNLNPFYVDPNIQSTEIRTRFDNDTTNGNYDNGSNYNNVIFSYIAPKNGNYKVTANVNVTNAIGDLAYNEGDIITRVISGEIQYTMNVYLRRNGVDTIIDTITQTRKLQYTQTVNYTYVISTPLVCTVEYPLIEGDEIFIGTNYKLLKTGVYTTLGQIVNGGTYYRQIAGSKLNIEMLNEPIYEGEYYNLNNLLTDDLCVDFLTSLNKMFNLVYEQDTNKINSFKIEPRKDFYNGSVIDWTYKHNRDSEAEIIPISEINDKNLVFKYSEDGDYYNNDYQTKVFETYGQYKYDTQNEFVDKNSTYDNTLIFAPTPLVDEKLIGTNTGKIISTIYGLNGDIPTAFNSSRLRILFYKGKIDSEYWLMTSRFENSIYDNSYAYAGYLDNPNQPTEDLDFWFPKQYYYTRTNLTNSNLFNKYWRSFIEDVYSKDSKLFIGDFYLNTNDIYNFSFRNIIYFDRKYWVVNKIIDFNPLVNQPTRVELLSLENYRTPIDFVDSNEQFINLNGGGYLVAGDTPLRPITDSRNLFNTNIIKGFDNIINGYYNGSNIVLGNANLLGSYTEGSFVTGDGNTLGGGSMNSLLFGEENNLYSGIHKSLVVGSGNTATYRMSNSFVMGDNNELSATTNVFLFGDDNILSGVTNSFIVGSGLTLNNLSNTLYSQNLITQSFSATSISASTISAAGSNTQLQYNNNGNLGANSDLVWDNINKNFSVYRNGNRILAVDSQSNYFGLGDLDGYGNNSRLVISNGSNPAIALIPGEERSRLDLDGSTKTIKLGDTTNVGSGTKIIINDAISDVSISANTFTMNGTSGYTGTIPFSATSINVVNGIIVGYT